MVKYNQLVFLDGKEKALDALFKGDTDEQSSPAIFGYLAIGYNETDNGFEDPADEDADVDENGGFKEIVDATGYKRIPLTAVAESTVKDPKNGQIIKKYEAELPADVITNNYINQFAICDNGDVNSDTTFYSAATFTTFLKTDSTSITFIIGFKI